ncbi:hypothetical protein [Nocardioides limicola]|uniref:hypothetical protein n=1 Tax=Nocardioides limicola TaxID=2803368 RepID=UPI0027DC81BB|nr:hypothetical protein [Nocardioides sp. DJM-14]
MSPTLEWFVEWMSDVNWLHFGTIPIFTGVIGWLINWTGLWMLFSPIKFYGFNVPGLREVASILPRKLQEVPGWTEGGLGWQGIIPARAAKMGSIAVDKAIAKLGTPAEFYQQLEPDKIAEHIVATFRPEIPNLVDEVMRREHPQLWADLPLPVREAIIDRVQRQLPRLVGKVTKEIGIHIDQLLDPKIMVIDHFRKNPELVVRVFRDVGQRELNLMVLFGFIFGFLLGVPVAFIDHAFHSQWWVLPTFGIAVGWITNLLGMWLIFEPVQPRKIGPYTLQGLFLKRQEQAADVYASIIADDVITLERIGDFLLDGPRGDRTRRMLAEALKPAIEDAAGPARTAVRIAVGSRRFDGIRDSFSEAGVGLTLTPFKDAEFSRAQGDKIRTLVAARTKELPPEDFVEMMRSAIKEDEWMLYAHGAIMGAAGGFLHYAIFILGGFG